ncbi:MAG: hypothetical protein QW780_05635 [Sulfolobales archaeon]
MSCPVKPGRRKRRRKKKRRSKTSFILRLSLSKYGAKTFLDRLPTIPSRMAMT